MPFDTVGALVMAKPFGLHTGIASILHRLRINDKQSCPLWVFLLVDELENAS